MLEIQLKNHQIKHDGESEMRTNMEQILVKMSEDKVSGKGETSSECEKVDSKKSIKSEMPIFDGSNVHGWIYKAKKYLRYHVFP